MSRVIVITCTACLVAAGVVGALYYYVQAQQVQSVLTPVSVSRRHLIAEVSISGTSKASKTVDLAFKNSGIVDSVPVSVGESVATDTILMALRSNTLKNQLSQARANVSAQIAKLRDIENGTRTEQLAITQAELDGGGTALESTQRELLAAISSAQSAADVVVRFTISQFITNPSTSNTIALVIGTGDTLLGPKVLEERKQIGPALSSWSSRLTSLQDANVADLLTAGADMHTYLQTISNILDGLTQILAMNGIEQFSLYQTIISTARTTINSTDAELAAAKRDVQSAQAAMNVTGRQLGLERAGPTSETAAVQQAIVDGARAQVTELKDEIKDQNITAPFSGTITNVNAKQGEAAIAGAGVVSMISNGPLKIEGYVPEVHYAEIAVGQPVRIQLDAFPGESFPGTLGFIDPTAALRDGVPNFKVTVYFTNHDVRIRPGLTASAFIQTADKTNSLAIPLAAVTGYGDKATVMRLIGGTVARVPIVLGITGTDGYVEVVSGLTEGDSVLVDETKQYRIIPN